MCHQLLLTTSYWCSASIGTHREPVYAYAFEGIRYDVGDKLGFLKATVEYTLCRPDLGLSFENYLQELDVEE